MATKKFKGIDSAKETTRLEKGLRQGPSWKDKRTGGISASFSRLTKKGIRKNARTDGVRECKNLGAQSNAKMVSTGTDGYGFEKELR